MTHTNGTSKRPRICPKCGSCDVAFVASGLRKCNACGHKGRNIMFKQGGPKPKNKLDIREQDVLTIGTGALWHRPIKYGDYD